MQNASVVGLPICIAGAILKLFNLLKFQIHIIYQLLIFWNFIQKSS